MTTRFELRQGENGVILSNGGPAYGTYPFEQWSTPQFLIDHQAPEIPLNQPAGEYELFLRLLAADGSTLYFGSLGSVTVEASDILFDPPAFPDALRSDALFGEEIALYSYVPPSAETATNSPLFGGRAPPTADYTTFVHLLAPDGPAASGKRIGRPVEQAALAQSGSTENISSIAISLNCRPICRPAITRLKSASICPGSGQRLTVSATAKHGEDYLFLRDVSVTGDQ